MGRPSIKTVGNVHATVSPQRSHVQTVCFMPAPDLAALAAGAEVDVHLVADPRDGRPADQLAAVRERAAAPATGGGGDRLHVSGHPHPGARDAPERGIVGVDRRHGRSFLSGVGAPTPAPFVGEGSAREARGGSVCGGYVLPVRGFGGNTSRVQLPPSPPPQSDASASRQEAGASFASRAPAYRRLKPLSALLPTGTPPPRLRHPRAPTA